LSGRGYRKGEGDLKGGDSLRNRPFAEPMIGENLINDGKAERAHRPQEAIGGVVRLETRTKAVRREERASDRRSQSDGGDRPEEKRQQADPDRSY